MKYAVLVDGGFVIKKLQRRNHFPKAAEVMARVDLIRRHEALADGELLRTYFYHAMPAKDELKHPLSGGTLALADTQTYRNHESLIQSLETQPDVAVRLGECSAHGWMLGKRAFESLVNAPRQLEERDLQPNVTQKGVDLRIALDIARLALRNMVDVLVVVTADSDFVPAFKFARREGLRIYLDNMTHGIRRPLKVHVDRMLELPKAKPAL